MPKRGNSVASPCGTDSRLRVGGRVRPRHRDLHAAQIVAAVLAERHQIGDRLRRMVDVALQVDQRDVGPLRDLAHVAVPHVRRPGRGGSRCPCAVAGEDDAHVLRALAVRDLRLVGVEVVRVAAELGHAGLEGVARARGLVEEQHEERLVRQEPVRLAGFASAFSSPETASASSISSTRPVDRLDVVLADEGLPDRVAVGERRALHGFHSFHQNCPLANASIMAGTSSPSG